MMIVLNETDMKKSFDCFFYKFENININNLKLNDIGREYNGFNFIRRNLFTEFVRMFEQFQPKTAKQIKKGKFFYAIKKSCIPVMNDITEFGIIINNLSIYIYYSPRMSCFKEFIPEYINKSWLFHSRGWDFCESIVMDWRKSALPSGKLSPIHSIIDDFENKKNITKNSEFLEQKFNHAFRRVYGDERYFDDEKYFELRCLLDTRPNEDYSKSGFQLFVSSHNNECNVYVVPNADVTKIQLLDNAADAIDSYAAHLFSRKEGEFDFWQYAKDF